MGIIGTSSSDISSVSCLIARIGIYTILEDSSGSPEIIELVVVITKLQCCLPQSNGRCIKSATFLMDTSISSSTDASHISR